MVTVPRISRRLSVLKQNLMKILTSQHIAWQHQEAMEMNIIERVRNNTGQWINYIIDNGWVVPYCPYLITKYRANINVELCNSVQGVKYLFKYVKKGLDRSMVAVCPKKTFDQDEIEQYEDLRYISYHQRPVGDY